MILQKSKLFRAQSVQSHYITFISIQYNTSIEHMYFLFSFVPTSFFAYATTYPPVHPVQSIVQYCVITVK